MAERVGVLVGYDGSEGAKRALRWAAEEAALRAVPLTILHAWLVVVPGFVVVPMENLAEGAQALAKEAAEGVRAAHPELEVRTRVECGSAPALLIGLSGKAELTVVGRSGSSSVGEVLVGSVSAAVSMHAHGLVTVVKDTVEGDSRPVLTAVDGSEAGDLALEAAFTEAHLRRAPLRVLCVWPEGTAVQEVPFLDGDGLRAICRDRFEEAVGRLRAKYPDVDATASFVDGDPADRVIEASEEARLLVVGSRGRGAVRGFFLGSVSQVAVHHARCSVMVAHRPET